MCADASDATTGVADSAASAARPTQPYSLAALVGYFFRLGSIGFGGPVALVGYMHRDLVESRRWISDEDYKDGLALAQLAPGPLAAQLAIYLGSVHYGVLGATLAGIAFVLPSFVMVLVLGWAYRRCGGLDWMQAVFYGVGACVIGIIAISAKKLTFKTLAWDPLLWAVYLTSAAWTIYTESEIVWLFLGAGVLVWLIRAVRSARGPALLPLLMQAAPAAADVTPAIASQADVLWQIGMFFSKAGAFVFGSGLAIVPFLYSGVVKEYRWLTESQFLDAVAVAMITPGPVVITVAFIGFLVAGLAGATVAAAATFLPCYLFTILPAPYFKKYGRRPGIAAFVDGVTAAAVGAIAGTVIVLGRKTILHADGTPAWPKLVLLLVTMAVLSGWRRVPEPLVVLAAAALGLLIYPWVR